MLLYHIDIFEHVKMTFSNTSIGYFSYHLIIKFMTNKTGTVFFNIKLIFICNFSYQINIIVISILHSFNFTSLLLVKNENQKPFKFA